MKLSIKYKLIFRVSAFLVFTLFAFNSEAQNDTIHAENAKVVSRDTIIKSDKEKEPIMKVHSPKRATILSAVLPGAGQIYNKKYWKLPLVYGAIGTCLYLAIDHNSEQAIYFEELVYRANNPGLTLNPEYDLFSDANLTDQVDFHKKWRDNFFVFTGVAYILNIIDANVDAHLFNFDVSDDLTLNLTPYSEFSLAANAPVSGVSLRLNFK